MRDLGNLFKIRFVFVFRFTSLLFSLLFLHFAGYKLYFQVCFFLIFTVIVHADRMRANLLFLQQLPYGHWVARQLPAGGVIKTAGDRMDEHSPNK